MVVVMMVTVMLLRKSGARNEHDQGEQQCSFRVPYDNNNCGRRIPQFWCHRHHSCRLHVMWYRWGNPSPEPFPQISVGTIVASAHFELLTVRKGGARGLVRCCVGRKSGYRVEGRRLAVGAIRRSQGTPYGP